MTLPGIRSEAARIITNHGAREDQAESILREFTAVGLVIIRPLEPVAPDTGEKAEPPAAYVAARQALKGITTTTEETP